MEQLEMGNPTILERLRNILINLAYLFGNNLAQIDLKFLRELLLSFISGYQAQSA